MKSRRPRRVVNINWSRSPVICIPLRDQEIFVGAGRNNHRVAAMYRSPGMSVADRESRRQARMPEVGGLCAEFRLLRDRFVSLCASIESPICFNYAIRWFDLIVNEISWFILFTISAVVGNGYLNLTIFLNI